MQIMPIQSDSLDEVTVDRQRGVYLITLTSESPLQCVLKMAWTAGLAVLSSIRQSPASDQEAVVSLREHLH